MADGFVHRHRIWASEEIEAAERIAAAVRERGLRFVRLVWVDQHGLSRAKSYVAQAFLEGLEEGFAFTDGPLFCDLAGAVVYNPFIRGGGLGLDDMTGAPNFVVVPDPFSFKVLPHVPAVGWIICDAYRRNGEPLPYDTRRVLKEALKSLSAHGLRAHVGLEIEFYLARVADPRLEIVALGRPGLRGEPPVVKPVDKGYFYQSEMHQDQNWSLLEQMAGAMIDLGLPLRTIEDESGPGQYEMILGAMNALEAADAMVVFRTVSKQVAWRHGHVASFMCRPGIPGFLRSSGWHIHFSFVDSRDRNVFASESGELLSPVAMAALGGILEHTRGACVFTTPTVNGYKRLRANSLAPDRACWGVENRGAMVRVVGGYGAAQTHLENRVAEPGANPYLAIAAQIVTSSDGIARGLDPGAPVLEAYIEERPRLPRSLGEAVDALRLDERLQAGMGGKMFVDYYIGMKESEWGRYQQWLTDKGVADSHEQVTDWEQREYFELL